MSDPKGLQSIRAEAVAARKPGMTNSADVADAERKIRYLATEDAYDMWATVYDTDGNFLQAIDDRELATLLPKFLALSGVLPADRQEAATRQHRAGPEDAAAATESVAPNKLVVDLGCGTGRNTAKLWTLLRTQPEPLEIVGLDSSREMLRVAERKFEEQFAELGGDGKADGKGEGEGEGNRRGRVEFRRFDINCASESTDPAPDPLGGMDGRADALVSTLVLEHIALPDFFRTVAALVRPGAHVLLTNMHDEMGRISQAGFVDPLTGEKIRPTSYAHSPADTVDEAARWGFELLDESERGVEPEDVELLGRRSGKWVGVMCWYALVFRLAGANGGEA